MEAKEEGLTDSEFESLLQETLDEYESLLERLADA